MRILGSRSGFRTVRDLVSYGVGIAGLVFVLTRHDGVTNYPAMTLFLGFIGAPYVLQRDERHAKPEDDEESKPAKPKKAPAKKAPVKRSVRGGG